MISGIRYFQIKVHSFYLLFIYFFLFVRFIFTCSLFSFPSLFYYPRYSFTITASIPIPFLNFSSL
ncbi:hypothetical protein BGW37DRAFT_505847 [Umbelopsis sp. PMI_123]|nr:hypothetical protein BGW37DRAFT_505847 [Umbelopsis sp. PMI_123]